MFNPPRCPYRHCTFHRSPAEDRMSDHPEAAGTLDDAAISRELVRRRAARLKRFTGHPSLVIGTTILLVMVLVALFAPWLAPYSPVRCTPM